MLDDLRMVDFSRFVVCNRDEGARSRGFSDGCDTFTTVTRPKAQNCTQRGKRRGLAIATATNCSETGLGYSADALSTRSKRQNVYAAPSGGSNG
jgi:hypothetical protein